MAPPKIPSENLTFSGRAWLYFALMDHLLESYLRCFLTNPRVVNKYYVKEALVRDKQVWTVEVISRTQK